jgi:membrane-associated HD superfamily phosphohydrolase
MAILDEKGLSGLVKKFLDLIFLGGAAILLGLPFVLKWYMTELDNTSRSNYYFLLFFLYFTGLFCLWIVYEMKKIFKTLNRKNPFMLDNVICLKRMSIGALTISAAYIVKIIFLNSILTIVIAMVFLIAGLFLVILAEVFKQAVEFKQENDLTI